MKKFKNIKLMLLALLAASSVNATPLTPNGATRLFTFKSTESGDVKTAVITGFVSELPASEKTNVAIPATVTDITDPTKQYDVNGIDEAAFKNEPIAEISFFTPAAGKPGIATIGAGAFEGTNITTLNLVNTKIEALDNLFGTLIDPTPAKKDKKNEKLQSIALPATLKTIGENALVNCTALTTIDFSKATKLATLGSAAFAGTAVTTLDFTGNTVLTTLPNDLLNDGTRYTSNDELTTVKLVNTVISLGTTFKDCKALSSINTAKVKTFAASAFENDAALTSIDLSAATEIGTSAFASTGLTAVTFPATGLKAIPEKAFWQCSDLKTVTFTMKKNVSEVASIGSEAFAYTGLESFTIPARIVKMNIGAKAFAGNDDLEEFTYAPNNGTEDVAYDGKEEGIVLTDDIFSRCSDITFYTTETFAKGFYKVFTEKDEDKKEGPTNSTFNFDDDHSTKFTTVAYKSNSSKYYVKWYNKDKDIKIKKEDAKVYSAFVDEKDFSINMQPFYAKNGVYEIKAGDAVLIITDKADLSYETTTVTQSSSYITTASVAYTTSPGLVTGNTANALKYTTEATTRATLESLVDEDTYVYGWVNTASACGFQKISSGKNIPEGTLFLFSKPAAAGRLVVNWLDENGNVVDQTTAIQSVSTVAEAENGEIFNLQGARVNGTQKGVYIKNGKKFIVK